MFQYNWRDVEVYNYTNKFTAANWAWEFIRRNPQYQAAWTENFAKYIQELDEENDIERIRDPNSPHLRLRFNDCFKWGLQGFINPILEKPYPAELNTTYGSLSMGPRENFPEGYTPIIMPHRAEDKHYASIGFDLSKEIEPQIKAARSILIRWQKIKIRQGTVVVNRAKPRVDNYKTYIRLLDAISQNTKRQDIIEELYRKNLDILDPEQTFKDHKKAALHLRDSGYFHLIC